MNYFCVGKHSMLYQYLFKKTQFLNILTCFWSFEVGFNKRRANSSILKVTQKYPFDVLLDVNAKNFRHFRSCRVDRFFSSINSVQIFCLYLLNRVSTSICYCSWYSVCTILQSYTSVLQANWNINGLHWRHYGSHCNRIIFELPK